MSEELARIIYENLKKSCRQKEKDKIVNFCKGCRRRFRRRIARGVRIYSLGDHKTISVCCPIATFETYER
jgi:hypothetical protein